MLREEATATLVTKLYKKKISKEAIKRKRLKPNMSSLKRVKIKETIPNVEDMKSLERPYLLPAVLNLEN